MNPLQIRGATPARTAEPSVTALERRISELEQLATSQDPELRIQFERIAQLPAEWNILRFRFTRSSVSHIDRRYHRLMDRAPRIWCDGVCVCRREVQMQAEKEQQCPVRLRPSCCGCSSLILA